MLGEPERAGFDALFEFGVGGRQLAFQPDDMRSISNIVAASALLSLATASDAPIARSSNLKTGASYSATLPNAGRNAITGAVTGAVSPDGVGTNFQISFYNLPGSGSFCMFSAL